MRQPSGRRWLDAHIVIPAQGIVARLDVEPIVQRKRRKLPCLVPVIPWPLERAGPDATPSRTSKQFIHGVRVRVACVGDCITLSDHPRLDVNASTFSRAASNRPSVSVETRRIAPYPLATNKTGQSLCSKQPALIHSTSDLAGLGNLWSVDAVQPDARAGQIKSVTVDNTCITDNDRTGRERPHDRAWGMPADQRGQNQEQGRELYWADVSQDDTAPHTAWSEEHAMSRLESLAGTGVGCRRRWPALPRCHHIDGRLWARNPAGTLVGVGFRPCSLLLRMQQPALNIAGSGRSFLRHINA